MPYNLHLITAVNDLAHITPAMDAAWHRGLAGSDSGVLNFADKFEPTWIDNNTFRIGQGVGFCQGRFFYVPANASDTITLDSGVAGETREDIISLHIEDNSGIQTAEWYISKGTTPPEGGDLDQGGTHAYYPMFKASFDGTTLEQPIETLFDVTDDLQTLQGFIETLQADMLKKEDAMVLLWKNPSPSSTTAGIEAVSTSPGVTPDFARINEFTFYKILMRANTSNWYLTEHIVKKRSSADDPIPLYNYWVEPDSSGTSNFFGVMTRPCKIISNKIYFGNCYDKRINSNGSVSAKTARTSDFIPYAVYGIPGLT